MRCSELEKFVYVYLDGEFEPRECAEFEEHLRSCDACREMLSFERSFHDILRKRLDRQAAPAALRSRILADVRKEARQEGGVLARVARLPLVVKAAPALAAAAAALVIFWPAAPSGQGAAEDDSAVANIVAETVANHEAALPSEVWGDRERIDSFLSRSATWADPPFRDTDSTRLVGARLARIKRRPAVLYHYEHKGKRLSVLQFADARHERSPFQRAYFTGRRDGYNVALFQDETRGVTNSLASDLDEKDLVGLIPANYRP